MSNNYQALSTEINQNQPKSTEINLSVNDISLQRALGILWNPEPDSFLIHSNQYI